jgi:hypothetical protein
MPAATGGAERAAPKVHRSVAKNANHAKTNQDALTFDGEGAGILASGMELHRL